MPNQNDACCTHLHINYVRVELPGGRNQDSWSCKDCGHEFIPRIVPNQNEALRLIERLGAALLAEHECYADRGVVCAECNLCKEAREFLAVQRLKGRI